MREAEEAFSTRRRCYSSHITRLLTEETVLPEGVVAIQVEMEGEEGTLQVAEETTADIELKGVEMRRCLLKTDPSSPLSLLSYMSLGIFRASHALHCTLGLFTIAWMYHSWRKCTSVIWNSAKITISVLILRLKELRRAQSLMDGD